MLVHLRHACTSNHRSHGASTVYERRIKMTDLKIPAWIATSTDVNRLKEVRKRPQCTPIVAARIDARLAQIRQSQGPQERTVHINALIALGVGPFPMDGDALSEAAFYRKVHNQWDWSNTRIAHEVTGRPKGALHHAWWDRVIGALVMAHLNGEVVPLTPSSIEWAEQKWRPLTPEKRRLWWEEFRDRAPIQAGEPEALLDAHVAQGRQQTDRTSVGPASPSASSSKS
jgi:hypothetical protein